MCTYEIASTQQVWHFVGLEQGKRSMVLGPSCPTGQAPRQVSKSMSFTVLGEYSNLKSMSNMMFSGLNQSFNVLLAASPRTCSTSGFFSQNLMCTTNKAEETRISPPFIWWDVLNQARLWETRGIYSELRPCLQGPSLISLWMMLFACKCPGIETWQRTAPESAAQPS